MKVNMDKINALADEIAHLYMLIDGIKELMHQSNIRFATYQKYHVFFYTAYKAYVTELYLGISRLQDKHRDTTSIIHLLDKCDGCKECKQCIKCTNCKEISQKKILYCGRATCTTCKKCDAHKACNICSILELISKNTAAEKINKWRDKILAHNDHAPFQNPTTRQKFAEENNLVLHEIEELLGLLVKAWELGYEGGFLKPPRQLKAEIENLFKDLEHKPTSIEEA